MQSEGKSKNRVLRWSVVPIGHDLREKSVVSVVSVVSIISYALSNNLDFVQFIFKNMQIFLIFLENTRRLC